MPTSIRVVPFDELLAAHRVDDRCAERVRERDHFVVRAAQYRCRTSASPRPNRSARPRAGQYRCPRAGWSTAPWPTKPALPRRVAQCHVAGQHDHGNAALFDRRAHRAGEHAGELRGVRHQFDVVAAFLEQRGADEFPGNSRARFPTMEYARRSPAPAAGCDGSRTGR